MPPALLFARLLLASALGPLGLPGPIDLLMVEMPVPVIGAIIKSRGIEA